MALQFTRPTQIARLFSELPAHVDGTIASYTAVLHPSMGETNHTLRLVGNGTTHKLDDS